MDDNLKNFVRSEWFAHYRWTAGLSTFLIGISFSILAFMHNNNGLKHMIPLGISAFSLLWNVILIRRLLKVSLWEVYHKMAFGFKTNDEKKRFDELIDNKVIKFESRIQVTFWIGFGFFIAFVVSYLIN